jgi:hypothetical protein
MPRSARRCSAAKKTSRRDAICRVSRARTGIAATDFSRIRNADLRRFMSPALCLSVINGLGLRIEVKSGRGGLNRKKSTRPACV